MCCTTHSPVSALRIFTEVPASGMISPDSASLFFKADEGGKGGVVQDEVIGFAMLGNEHGEIRDEFLPLGASGLMHHIQAVREVLRLGKNHRNLSAGYPVQTLWRSRNCRRWPGRPETQPRPPAAQSAPHRW